MSKKKLYFWPEKCHFGPLFAVKGGAIIDLVKTTDLAILFAPFYPGYGALKVPKHFSFVFDTFNCRHFFCFFPDSRQNLQNSKNTGFQKIISVIYPSDILYL